MPSVKSESFIIFNSSLFELFRNFIGNEQDITLHNRILYVTEGPVLLIPDFE